jgi:hypothetical protein
MPVPLNGPFDSEIARSDQLYLPCSIAKFQWASIISKVKQSFYRLKPGNIPNTSIHETQQELQTQLDRWLDQSLSVADTLPPTHRLRFTTKFKIDYQFALGLLHQPSQTAPHPDDRALRICFESAKARIRLSDTLYRQNSLVIHWPSTHGIFLAGATYVYSIWASSELRSSVSPAEVAGDLRLCSSLLALGGEWWPVARRGKGSFDRLADATLGALMSRGSAPVPRQQLAPTDEPAEMPSDDYQWLDVEALLQPYLQNDLQFPDLLGSVDMTAFETPASQFNGSGYFNESMGPLL